MSTFGVLGEFKDGGEEEWTHYVERMQHYFTANDVKSKEKQLSIFLSVCGASTYKLISSLVAPKKPGDCGLDELLKLISEHKNPKPSFIVQRFKFNSRIRKTGESISAYVAELRHIAENCQYGTSLEDMLRDRLVCGVADDRIQRRLLAETELPFAKAMQIASAMELADKNTADLRGSTPETVNKTTAQHGRREGNGKGPARTKQWSKRCGRCGRVDAHPQSDCPARNLECYKCGKMGHISQACRSKSSGPSQKKPNSQWKNKPQSGRKQNAYQIEDTSIESEQVNGLFFIGKIENETSKPLVTKLQVAGAEVEFQIDTGASVSVMSESAYNETWDDASRPQVRPSDSVLRTYTQECIPIKGECEVLVQHGKQSAKVRLIIACGSGPNLMGRDWLKVIRLNWAELHNVAMTTKLSRLLSENDDLFSPGLGELRGMKVNIDVDSSATPKFVKARPVPFAMKSKVESELDRLVNEGILEPVQYSRWAAPIVPVVKSDGSVRICGDYKVTINQATKGDAHPIPRIDELFAKLSGGKVFSKLDLSHAYQQLVLDENSREYVTINTHRGLFRYTRLPFGITTAPAIFQRTMESLLAGIPHVMVYLDDILVTGDTDDNHIATLEAVMNVLREAGLRLKKEKCVFLTNEVEYLGHKINAEGLQPTEEKFRAITEAQRPRNVSELKSYLGILNYYGKFLPNLASTLEPLHRLLRKGTRWHWTSEQQKSFDDSKQLLKSSQLLTHYDSDKDLVLSCDASPYGVGAVLSHKMADGSEKPIGYASRTLNSAERNYSQLDKEGLAIIFGVKKFHQYVYGRKFRIVTDHKPLLGLLGEKKAIPQMASPRVQRWAITLAAYEYNLVYKQGKANANADALSRLPMTVTAPIAPLPAETVQVMNILDNTPVTSSKIRAWTNHDRVLSRVRHHVMSGWPVSIDDDDMKPYSIRKDELSVQDGCVLWGSRVVVPIQGRKQLIEELHGAHSGIVRMKALARSYVWWPKIDKELELKVKSCHTCQKHQRLPPKAPVHQWEYPSTPWERVHIDYMGPFEGKMLLIIVDAHSKWIDAHVMTSSTSTATINRLRQTFATHGIPQVLVSDNGSAFTSAEFNEFMSTNTIRHIRSAPYHPATNGLAERAVQTLKAGLRKLSGGSLETRVARFLFTYRTTPHAVTGVTPAFLLMKRQLRSRLDAIRPNIKTKVDEQIATRRSGDSRHRRYREFEVGEAVLVKNHAPGDAWVPGTVIAKTGPISYDVEVVVGTRCLQWKRHVDHLRHRPDDQPRPRDDDFPPMTEGNDDVENNAGDDIEVNAPGNHDRDDQDNDGSPHRPTTKQYPKRNRNPPAYYWFE